MPDLSSQEAPEDLDWELHAWTEVNLDTFKELSDQLKERAALRVGEGGKDQVRIRLVTLCLTF